ncbi:hypothetical protein ANCDUO_13061 [Ancylostoma duodenale]|uniref:Uncharacterized protein n=1 Tax=Ancylostoma duodenale TaxID=51022 RepID=A0A0C2G710_9BILA|nr:hypothetical protein ANCDUO_13061 [Ancylostoma duodenale]
MPPRTRRTTSSVAPTTRTLTNGSGSAQCSAETDFATMSPADLLNAILDRNSDPVVDRMLRACIGKMPLLATERIEKEKRSRSIMIAGLEEAPPNLRPSRRQKDLGEKVTEVLDAMDLECRLLEVRRMGRMDLARPQLVKVVFATTQERARALDNARLLRTARFKDVFVRKSMTEAERKKEFDLHQLVRERNGVAGAVVIVGKAGAFFAQ